MTLDRSIEKYQMNITQSIQLNGGAVSPTLINRHSLFLSD